MKFIVASETKMFRVLERYLLKGSRNKSPRVEASPQRNHRKKARPRDCVAYAELRRSVWKIASSDANHSQPY